MKAKIIKTGEIINIAEYAKIELDVCDSYGNPISVIPEDVELIPDVKEDNFPKIDWEQRRYEIAKAIITERVASADCIRSHYLAITTIEIADELISELKKGLSNERIKI